MPSQNSIPPFCATVRPRILTREETAQVIGYRALVDSLRQVMLERMQGLVSSPDRIGVPLADGGVSLSMPASAADISIHKLVNVAPANAALGLPTIHGIVTVCDATTGRPCLLLDGPEVTGRRTAGVTLVAIQAFFAGPVRQALLIGTGVQASHHVLAIQALYPDCEILVRGRDRAGERDFCSRFASHGAPVKPCPDSLPASVDVVVTLTTSRQAVYNEPPQVGRLVVGVGAFTPEMAELGEKTLLGSDIYADDCAGARHEAGDLLRAKINWDAVRPLAAALVEPRAADRPVVVKSVGSAAWDLAAARVALRALASP